MAVIHELSPHLADLIAAGEVVERPASVAKELIENAIDAGSTRITVEIENGGISYLRIADNGCGMAPEDAQIAFKRHATSKLRSESDLAAIGTLGFRGEALAAISAVSRIDLFTKQADTIAGVHLHLEAGTITENEEAGCPDGTTIIIRDLFYNTPARMKFLKKDFTEAGYVLAVVQHAALSHPEIAFSLIRDGKQTFSSSGNGQLKTPVFGVFGREIMGNMLEVAPFERESVTVWGYITKPHCARPNRSMQHFFVNGRYIKSRLMQAALEEAYKNAIITGKYPSCALFLTIPYSMVDVNVHPAKTEIKFAQEKPVFEAVYIACKNALEAGDNVPLLQQKPFSRPAAPREDHVTREQQTITAPRPAEPPLEELFRPRQPAEQPTARPSFTAPETKPAKRAFMPFIDCDDEDSSLELCAPAPGKSVPADPALDDTPMDSGAAVCLHDPAYEPELFAQPAAKIEGTEPAVPVQEVTEEEAPASAEEPSAVDAPSAAEPSPILGGPRVLGECFHTYIVAEEEDGLVLIDKHAAHERMIFNRLRSSTEIPTQTLLAPVIAELPASLAAVTTEHIEEVRRLGFDIEPFGAGSFAVRAIPAYLDPADVPETLSEIADKLASSRSPVPDRLDDLIHTVSCKAAIKGGWHTDITELQSLCERVLADPEVRACPHGRPTVVRLTKYEIDKLFKRVNQ